MLTLEELTNEVAAGAIDTVVVAFTDMQGRLMGKRVEAHFFVEEMEDKHPIEGCNYLLALDMEMDPVPGYEMASWERGYGDFSMLPDFATMRRIPWLEGTALVLCDVAWNDGKPVRPSPRQVLKAQVERARALGFEAMFGSELEFYLMKETFAEAHEKHYRGLTPSVPYILDYHILATSYDEPFIRAVRNGMQAAGIKVENSKGEAWPGQQEINFRYSDAVTMADNHVIYKNGIKEMAHQHGCSVTFMAKPDHTWIGSSCHIHSSLWRGTTARSPASPRSSSSTSRDWSPARARWRSSWRRTSTPTSDMPRAAGRRRRSRGVMTTARAASAWSATGSALRVECRIPGADANPYLAFAALLAAGLHGIENKLEPPPAFTGQRVRVRCAAIPAHAQRGDRGARARDDRARVVRRRRRRPLPELRAHRAAALRSRRDLLRARTLLRARMTLRLLNPATEQPLAELEQRGSR